MRAFVLYIVPGIDRRILTRWRAWWLSTFAEEPFALLAKATFMPAVDIASLPASLLDRSAGDIAEQHTALLRFLWPLNGGTLAMCTF
jgi:hypothetical protein